VERLLRIESCKILRISTYWGHRRTLDYHRDMIVALLARAPVSERTWAAPRLNALDAEAMRMRANLDAEVTSCVTADPWLIPNGLRGRDVWGELQELRGELAARIDEADSAAGRRRPSQPRTAPCPVLPLEPSGPTRRIRKAPDLNVHYPQEAIDENVTGSVRVRFGYDASGCVVEASVYRSSGSDLLDQAAIAFAFDTVIVPELKDGVPATGFAVMPLHFNITAESESSAEPAPPASLPK
jgi:TonB family protein